MRIGLVLAAMLAAAPMGAPAQDAASRNLAAACAICHGTGGQSATGVVNSLAGMPQGDFTARMNGFRNGTRPATVMHQIAKGYNDAQIDAMAAWFAAQPR
ncbi:MAG: c-type cytochrome [Betaproteobacteria bacterium]